MSIQILLIYSVPEWWMCVQVFFPPLSPTPPEGEGRVMLNVFKMEFGQRSGKKHRKRGSVSFT